MLMEEQLESFPFQIKEALKIKERISAKNLKNINKIVIFGMGGSGCAGTLFKDFLIDKIKTPIVISKNTFLPIDSKTLVFVLSYSGNTQETIRLYNYARKKTKQIFIFTSGGKLGKEKQIIKIPKGFAPRESVVFMVSAMLVLIGMKNYLKDIKVLKFSEKEKKSAKEIAKKLYGKIPIIYAGEEKLGALAYKWKINFNETGKSFAHSGFFTEINHNEIEAEMPKNVKILVLLNKDKNSFKIFNNFFKFEKIYLKGNNELERVFYGILLGDYTSYYLGLMNKKNPLKTPKIEKLKKLIKKNKVQLI